MMVLAVFTEDSLPKTGLTPTVDIYRLDTNTLAVDGGSMVEVGNGHYSCSFTAWDSALDYSCVIDSVTLTGSERYAYTSISASPIVEDTLSVNDILRIILAKEVGIAQGGGSSLIEFKSVDLAKTRVSMQTDMRGNRDNVILDGSE